MFLGGRNDRFIRCESGGKNWFEEDKRGNTSQYSSYLQTRMNSEACSTELLRSRRQWQNTGQGRQWCNEKTLQASNYRNDFYLNCMDWGDMGLVVALNHEVYVECPHGFQCVWELSPCDYVSSVRWVGHLLSVGDSNGDIILLDTPLQRPIRKIKQHETRVSAQCCHINDNLLTAGEQNSSLVTHDLRMAYSPLFEHQGHKGQICSLEVQPSTVVFASGSTDKRVIIWDLRRPDFGRKMKKHQGAIKALSWCPWKAGVLCSGGGKGDKGIRIWNTAEGGNPLSYYKAHSQVSGLIWHKASQMLISSHGSPENCIQTWQITPDYQLKHEKKYEGHHGRILQIAQSSEQDEFCTASADQTLRFWKAQQQAPCLQRQSFWQFK